MDESMMEDTRLIIAILEYVLVGKAMVQLKAKGSYMQLNQ